MANNAIGGFRWRRNKFGQNIAPVVEFPVASAYGTGIFRGDPVKLVSDGTVAAAAVGDATFGICIGAVRYKNSSGQIVAGNFLPASTSFSGAPDVSNPQASIVAIIPVQGQVFEIDMSAGQASITAARSFVNENFDVVAGAGTTASGRSGYTMDTTTHNPATATLVWRCVDVSPDPANDVTAANWKALVVCNVGNDAFGSSTTGV
jgi:hypothetical protein